MRVRGWDFTDGWLVHYNYLRPHESLQDKTPAEVAGVEYPYLNWADIIRLHKPTTKILIGHQPRDFIRLPETHIGRPHKLSIPKTPKPRQTRAKSRKTGGIFMSKSGAMSRHYFRGARRVK